MIYPQSVASHRTGQSPDDSGRAELGASPWLTGVGLLGPIAVDGAVVVSDEGGWGLVDWGRLVRGIRA